MKPELLALVCVAFLAPLPPVDALAAPAPSLTEVGYAPLKMTVGGETRCLTANGDDTKSWQYVALETCKDGSRLQNWKLKAIGNARYFIFNEYFGETRYLRTYGKASSIALDSDTSGYTTMRSWEVSNGALNDIRLWNVYSRDIGQWKTLDVDPQGQSVGISIPGSTRADVWQYDIDMPTPQFPVAGTKKVLVMATHFSDETSADSTPVRDTVLGVFGTPYYEDRSARNYLLQASGERLTANMDFLDEVDIGERPDACNASQILSAARDAARHRERNPQDYDYLFVSIRQWRQCPWVGLASVPGNWVLAQGSSAHKFWTWTHEFGHAMGFQHARILYGCPPRDGVAQLGGDCTTYNYGKAPTDPMGGGGASMFPVAYQHFAGWLSDADVPWIKHDGTYKLDPLWRRGSAAQGYRIRRSDGSVLFVEFRRPSQPFETWWEAAPYVNGVTVYVVNYSPKARSMTSTLVNTTPGSGRSMGDAPLLPNHSLDDTLSGMRLTVTLAHNDGAELKVEKLPK